ncbi:hypothetical protein DERF_006220 [Dermatophagoides farinae]|uniref:ETS domain-containing protein n=1 Tax=Dermatophagoides farinae TaxID=6954 RepID=A0A922L7G6_DERFA|nr:hypothetical protein DERF_006220 [Dermatophagoides farinae]
MRGHHHQNNNCSNAINNGRRGRPPKKENKSRISYVGKDKKMVAKMWGERKQNPRMTYEKLSRAMRYYYKSQVLLPVFGRRLVYKFGPNATGWRPIESINDDLDYSPSSPSTTTICDITHLDFDSK